MTTTPALRQLILVTCSTVFLHGLIPAQNLPRIEIRPSDRQAAEKALGDSGVHHSVKLGVNRQEVWGKEPSRAAGLSAGPTTFFPIVFPGNLINPANKPTLQIAANNMFYINPTMSPAQATWGNPDVFINELASSNFIHITDQYTLHSANSYFSMSYPLGVQAVGTASLPHFVHLPDIFSILHSGITTLGLPTGYGQMFHVFLPPNQDVCTDSGTANCYSPDMPNSFFFCGFHGAVTFSDIGHVLYTVEPYQLVPGCQVNMSPFPNGQLADSTASLLSHEIFETITDPDLNAWWNRESLDLFGAEIGDECQNSTFRYFNIYMTTKSYEIQSEYSDLYNGCSNTP